MAHIGAIMMLYISSTAQALPESDEEMVTLEDSPLLEMAYLAYQDSIEAAMHYDTTGTIDLGDGLATLTIPAGFKYLNPEQTDFVLTNAWGNPPSYTMGMILPERAQIFDSGTYAILIYFAEEGYVKDEDAEDLDYDELLETMQEDTREGNKQREKMGYEGVELIGWASAPFYDQENKKLHWAKELQFKETEGRTLNYDIRVLGRRGYLELSFISDIEQLDEVKANIPAILESVDFEQGHSYFDFDPSIDEVAAVGIGGLIAGKVLAKAGFFAIIAKFGKFILIGILAAFGALRRFVFGGKKEDA